MMSRAALAIALLSLVLSVTGVADAARDRRREGGVQTQGELGAQARQAREVPGQGDPQGRERQATPIASAARPPPELTAQCDPQSVDLGTWCLQSAPYPLPNEDIGKNDYFYASQACVAAGGFLPTAAQLIGAADRVKLASTIDDAPVSSSPDIDATDGLKDKREMSATLVTTQAGSSAAGSEGVSDGSKGDPKAGEPDPVPLPANPAPQSLQYVTVYDNHDKGGFAGSKPLSLTRELPLRLQQAPGPVAERRWLVHNLITPGSRPRNRRRVHET